MIRKEETSEKKVLIERKWVWELNFIYSKLYDDDRMKWGGRTILFFNFLGFFMGEMTRL